MSEHKGLIVKINPRGIIQEVILDDYRCLQKGQNLLTQVDRSSISQMFTFLKDINEQGGALADHIILRLNQSTSSFHCAGLREGQNITLFASTDSLITEKLYNDLMQINNEQTNQLRALFKKSGQDSSLATEELFEKLTKVNNELITMQRQSAQTNHRLSVLNARLTQKNQELDQFAAVVSHDLKSPLNRMVGLLHLIQLELKENASEHVAEMLELMQGQAKSMTTLIEGILEYARAGKAEKTVSPFSFQELLNSLIQELEVPEGFTITQSLPDTLHLTSYKLQLAQVLTNLLSNAIKYHHKQEGNISIIASSEEGMLHCKVVDDGPGIPAAYHTTLFDMFSKAHNSSRKDSTGIGLAIVKKLVQEAGGSISVESSPGQGSTFAFRWPLSAEQDKAGQ